MKNLYLLGAILSMLAATAVGCADDGSVSTDGEYAETQTHGAALEVEAPAQTGVIAVDDSVDPGEGNESAAGGTPEKPQPDPWRAVAILPEKPQPDPWYDEDDVGPDKPQPDPWQPASPESVSSNSQNSAK